MMLSFMYIFSMNVFSNLYFFLFSISLYQAYPSKFVTQDCHLKMTCPNQMSTKNITHRIWKEKYVFILIKI